MVLKNKSFDITVSLVIRIIGDFDKIGDFVLGDLRVTAKYKSVTFLDEFGVTVEVHECAVNCVTSRRYYEALMAQS